MSMRDALSIEFELRQTSHIFVNYYDIQLTHLSQHTLYKMNDSILAKRSYEV